MRGRHGQREVQEQLHGGHDHGGVGVQQAVIQHIHDVVHLLLIGGLVARDRLQHLVLRPIREVLPGKTSAQSKPTW